MGFEEWEWISLNQWKKQSKINALNKKEWMKKRKDEQENEYIFK